MNCLPLMRAVAESVAFLALSDDAVLNPDAAVSQLENLASILKELNDSDQWRFQKYIHEIATREEVVSGRTPRVEFLSKLADNLFVVN